MMEKENKSCCAASRESQQDVSTDRPSQKIKKSRREHITDDMVFIEGGQFLMGTNSKEGFPADGEGPIRKITIDSFYIAPYTVTRSEEHTSELQSRGHLVCRLL